MVKSNFFATTKKLSYFCSNEQIISICKNDVRLLYLFGMNPNYLYLFNVLCVALPLALFEISMEKANGCGSGWSKDKWYAKSVLRDTKFAKLLTKLTKLEAPLNYHLVLCGLIFPAIFILEYIYGSRNILVLFACLLGIIFFADIFWFMFNWYFDSFRQLLKGPNGTIFWHKSWVKISKNHYVPTVYPLWLGLSLVLLFIAQRFF